MLRRLQPHWHPRVPAALERTVHLPLQTHPMLAGEEWDSTVILLSTIAPHCPCGAVILNVQWNTCSALLVWTGVSVLLFGCRDATAGTWVPAASPFAAAAVQCSEMTTQSDFVASASHHSAGSELQPLLGPKASFLRGGSSQLRCSLELPPLATLLGMRSDGAAGAASEAPVAAPMWPMPESGSAGSVGRSGEFAAKEKPRASAAQRALACSSGADLPTSSHECSVQSSLSSGVPPSVDPVDVIPTMDQEQQRAPLPSETPTSRQGSTHSTLLDDESCGLWHRVLAAMLLDDERVTRLQTAGCVKDWRRQGCLADALCSPCCNRAHQALHMFGTTISCVGPSYGTTCK